MSDEGGKKYSMIQGKKRPCSGKMNNGPTKNRNRRLPLVCSCQVPCDDDHMFAPVHQREVRSLFSITKQFILEIKKLQKNPRSQDRLYSYYKNI